MAVNIQGLVQGFANTGQGEVESNAIGTIGPYVSHMSAPVAPVQQYNAASTTPSSQSGLSKFGHFIGGLASGIGHLGEQAAKWVYNTNKSMITFLPREATGIAHGWIDNSYINWNNQRTQQNSQRLQSLYNAYNKSHTITKAQYQLGLKELIADNNRITKDEVGLNNRINSDKQNTQKAMIDSFSAVATILTAGLGEASLIPAQLAEKGAAEQLASVNANAMLQNVKNGLNYFAKNEAAFGKLTSGMQNALQKSSAEIIAQAGANVSAKTMAQAAAANLALKYPMYYSYLSGTGNKLYEDWQAGKHGQFLKEAGLNALMILSGGPIGQALKYGGKAAGALGTGLFGRTEFVDNLSRGIGNGNPDGLYKEVMTHDFQNYKFFDGGKLVTLPADEARARVIQNLKATEAFNLAATTGRDGVAASNRVLNNMAAYEGISMRDFTHAEALKNLSDHAEAMRAADFHNPGSVVGRVDARDKNNIFTGLAPYISGDNKDAAHNAFDALIAENSQRPWTNNDNFIRQVRSLINKYDSGEAFQQAGKNIEATTEITDGFPQHISKELSKLGYIPIKPSNLEDPFKEGAADQKLRSAFAEDNSFFEKAAPPIPVLSHIGGVLQMAGLSPQAAETRAYQMYNGALASRLSGLDFLQTSANKSETPEHTADNVYKKLGEWVKQLNEGSVQRGGVSLFGTKIRPPIMDLRQLTEKDTAAALEVTRSEAKQVNHALRDAMLDVPLAVRGLGDRVVDAANNIPLFRSYMRVQGAGRFAWNPIFQGKLAAKTEAASQALSGGKIPVVLENILGRGPQVDATRQLLRNNGIFDKKAAQAELSGEVASGGEAVSEGTAVGANLTHKLLPIQERSIAGMINRQAAKVNMSPAQFLEQFPQETRDTVQMIAQYDRNSSFLHSPLMRTLNFAFFPMRFEYKVASIMAKSLAQTDTLTQVAVINGIMNAHNWLNSPEGMAWYQQNSQVLKFINYFSPAMTLSTVGQMLSGLSHDDWKTTVGAWELGGLPFGWIPQILQNEGAINISPGYVDPTSGEPLPRKIPNSAKAQLQTALGTFMGSLFTYPGAELGLTSKTKVQNFIGGALTGGQAKKSEFTQEQPYLSAQQQKYSQTIQGQTQQQKPNQTQQPTTVPQQTPIQITGTGNAAPVYKNGGPKTPRTPKTKKGQFKASLPA